MNKFFKGKSKGGFVLELFTLMFLMGLLFGFTIFYLLVAVGLVDMKIKVETRVVDPYVTDVSFNSFLITEDRSYPKSNGEMRNVISLFGLNEDSTSKNTLNNMIDRMFVYPNLNNVNLQVNGYVLKPVMLGERTTSKRKYAMPEGKFNYTILRVYK